jgi:hypothetical protein
MDEAIERRTVLLRLATDFEHRSHVLATFTGESPEEQVWLDRELARLASEGSITSSHSGPAAY